MEEVKSEEVAKEEIKIHRKQVLRKAIIMYVEETGIHYGGHNYKGKVVFVDDNQMRFDFGISNSETYNKAKEIADARVRFFAQDFSKAWIKRFERADYITIKEAEKFLESL